MSEDVKKGQPAVKLVRGPFVHLEPHPDHCETAEELARLCARVRAKSPDAILAADLFSGAGGLSLGLQHAGMTVVLGADHDRGALDTHRHHFPGMALDWDLGQAEAVEKLAQLLVDNAVDVLAGGPPCQPFSKAGRSRMRYLVREGIRDAHDRRRDMWFSYLEVARLARPRAVVMENVPDMALDREMFILRSMVYELERLGYAVRTRVVDAWRYGVPQFRQRLILVATRDCAPFEWPEPTPRKVTVANAISDLPPVEGGWRPVGGAHGWAPYGGPRTAFQREMRVGVAKEDRAKSFDHITRPVREDDEAAFELLDSESRYSDLPAHLKRYRDDIFDDKYKRLSGDDVSRTITAHIAKDGYWYIHPEQNRTLTVREAARLQTFPDAFRFSGPPSAAFKQIGNAVPPLLGRAVGAGVMAALARPATTEPASEDVARVLAGWFRSTRPSSTPWLAAEAPWLVLLGELTLDRTPQLVARSLWPILARADTPSKLLDDQGTLAEALTWIDRVGRLETVRAVAQRLQEDSRGRIGADPARPGEDQLDSLVNDHLVPRGTADLAMMSRSDGEEPVVVSAGAIRVATRFRASRLARRNQNTSGRLAIASMVGYGRDAGSAHLALLEIGNDICLPGVPLCGQCPLSSQCATMGAHDAQDAADADPPHPGS